MANLLMRRRGMKMEGAAKHGTWDDLFRAIDMGTHATEYAVGEIIPLTIGSFGALNAQIVAFNADAKADGTGNAAVTFITENTTTATHRFNPARTPDAAPFDEGTGLIGGWVKSELRTYVNDTVKPQFPADVLARIVSVVKYSRGLNTSGSAVNNVVSNDEIWVPSRREMFSAGESSGPTYTSLFSSNAARKKHIVGRPTSTPIYMLRTAYSTTNIARVFGGGQLDSGAPTNAQYLAFGFCVD